MDSLFDVKARMIRALAHPKRLEIVEFLEEEERTVTEIAKALRISRSGTSQHLSVLRRGGIVEIRRQGTFVYYRLADPAIATSCRRMNDALVAVLAREQQLVRPILAAVRAIH